MKHPKQVGMSCKNTRFVKRGLTWEEVQRVEKANLSDKLRWKHLFSINKYNVPKPSNEKEGNRKRQEMP
jgi:hypothetical protein